MLKVFRINGALLLNIEIADTFPSRLKELLLADSLKPNTGLLIRPCCCVHTMGMRHPIDLVFLSQSGVVIQTISALVPNRIKYVAAAHQVLELAEGEVARLGICDFSVLLIDEL